MLRILIFLFFHLFFTSILNKLFAQESAAWNFVKIGNQFWMTENLNVDTFRNGDIIQQAKSNIEWQTAGERKQPAWCYYESEINQTTYSKYGKLYNWYAVIDPRGLAPIGWHVPTDEDWSVLTNFLGGDKEAGKKLKSRSEWHYDVIGNNESGFGGLPGGYRNLNGKFEGAEHGYWWSSSDNNFFGAWLRSLSFGNDFIYRYHLNKKNGLNVRCLRD